MDTTEEKLNNELASISDQELYSKCRDILSQICSDGMKNFTMSVHVESTDSDMLLGELIRRFYENRIFENEAVSKETANDLLQDMIEVMADWLDSDFVSFMASVEGVEDPLSRHESELHIRMAKAATNEYLKTVRKGN